MAGNFEGIKKRSYGIEIEMTGLTRNRAAKAISTVLGNAPVHHGSSYDKYTVRDEKGREWSIVYDGSIRCVDRNGESASNLYSVELNSPILQYEDIPLLQSVVRALRKAGGLCSPSYKCGTHIHISADDYTPQQIRNLVNIFASKEDFLWEALQVSSARQGYCQKADREFVEKLNRKKPKTMEEIADLWYNGDNYDRHRHYSETRYRALNLHSFFQDGHYEIRCCNSSLHAGEVRSQIVLALAISNAAMTKKYCSPKVSQSDNMRYSFRVFLLNLGLIGDEFKNCRMHLLKHLDGCISWRHPEDAIAQRERLKQERIARREQTSEPISEFQEQSESLPDGINQAAVSDFEEEMEESMDFSMSM